MRYGRVILRQLVPGIPSLVLGAVAGVLFVLWLLLSVAMLLDPLDEQTMVGEAAVVGAVLFGPMASFFLALAGLVDRRLLARAGWFALAAPRSMSMG